MKGIPKEIIWKAHRSFRESTVIKSILRIYFVWQWNPKEVNFTWERISYPFPFVRIYLILKLSFTYLGPHNSSMSFMVSSHKHFGVFVGILVPSLLLWGRSFSLLSHSCHQHITKAVIWPQSLHCQVLILFYTDNKNSNSL